MIGSVDGRRDVAVRRSARTFWPSTAYWGLVGACAAFGLATAFTYGPLFFLAAAALLILGLIVRVIDKRASPAALAGISIAPFYVAWLNRRGPGEICEQIKYGTQCLEEWNPWPIAAFGMALLALSILILLRTRKVTVNSNFLNHQ